MKVNSRLNCRFAVDVFMALEYMFVCLLRAEIKAQQKENMQRQYGYM